MPLDESREREFGAVSVSRRKSFEELAIGQYPRRAHGENRAEVPGSGRGRSVAQRVVSKIEASVRAGFPK